jgi:hypothetical protein
VENEIKRRVGITTKVKIHAGHFQNVKVEK